MQKGTGFYTLRRTAATIAAQSGDVFAVQRLLGHTNILDRLLKALVVERLDLLRGQSHIVYQSYPFDSTTHYKWGLISLA